MIKFILRIFLLTFILFNLNNIIYANPSEYSKYPYVISIDNESKSTKKIYINKFSLQNLDWKKRISLEYSEVKDFSIDKNNIISFLFEITTHPNNFIKVDILPNGISNIKSFIHVDSLSFASSLYVLTDFNISNQHYFILIDGDYGRSFWCLKHPVYIAKVEELKPNAYYWQLIDTIASTKAYINKDDIKVDSNGTIAQIEIPQMFRNKIIFENEQLKFNGFLDKFNHRYYSITNNRALKTRQKKLDYVNFLKCFVKIF